MKRLTSIVAVTALGLHCTACAMQQKPAAVSYKGEYFYARDGMRKGMPEKVRQMAAANPRNASLRSVAAANRTEVRTSPAAAPLLTDDFEEPVHAAPSGSITTRTLEPAPVQSNSLPPLNATPLQPPAQRPVNTPMPLMGVSKVGHVQSAPVSTAFNWPVKGKVLERFGGDASGRFNDGIKIASYTGEPVRAAADGSVAYIGDQLQGYGQMIILRHEGGYITSYAHLSEPLVGRGDTVRRGEMIARAGNSGNVQSAQVYFGIRKDKEPVDPEKLLVHGEGRRMLTASLTR